MAATIRKRSRAEAALTDTTATPAWLAELLPEVDLDPASNSRSHIKARWAYSLEKGLDGLKLPWRGSVFVNPPYALPLPFAEKFELEWRERRCAEAIWLVKEDFSTSWAHALLAIDDIFVSSVMDLWTFHDRIQFEEHPDVVEKRRLERVEKAVSEGMSVDEAVDKITGKSTSNFCSVMIHHRFHDRPLPLDAIATRWGRF